VGGLPFGGIERWLYDLCLEYGRNGLLRPRVFNISGTGSMLPEYLDSGIEVENLARSKRALATWRFDSTLKLRRSLRAFAPDIIHTVHFMANYHGRLAAVHLGAPVLVHLRNIKRERRPFRRFADKVLSRLTTEYLAVSQAVAKVAQSEHNRAGRPVRVLYNALDPAHMAAEPLDFAAAYGLKGPVVLAVSRYVPQKNLDVLIRALGLLRGRGVAADLVLVGEGPERPRLEALRGELGLERHVVLTGFRRDVAAFYRSSAIFAMPSAFEGFLTAHLEAMYCGLPAVLSDRVPSLEIAAEACLVCAIDPCDVADKLERLLLDEELRARLGEKAWTLAREQTMARYAQSLHEIYLSLLADKSASG
jgi:glycosyltransferase involved in cell wall biosynthesis